MRRILLTMLCVTALGTLWTLAPKASADWRDLTSWTFTTIDVPGAGVTYARGVNGAGQIVGHYRPILIPGPKPVLGRTCGFLLSNGVFTNIQVADYNTDARGINPQGDVVGWVYDLGATPPRSRGYLFHEGAFTLFDYPGAAWTLASAINAAGDIVGWWYADPAVIHGFLLRNGVFTAIDVPGAKSITTARGINSEGEIVGDYDAVDPDGVTRVHGFLLRTDGTFTTIDGPEGSNGNDDASGINPRGEIVGEYDMVPGVRPRFGFLLTGGTYTTIMHPAAAQITRPWSISPDGQHIVGFYDDLHGFVLSRKPLP